MQNDNEVEAVITTNRPKRVRTGCLTCRERHLKCDEALPHCLNCRKSARVCKRGIRLNFIDTQCETPPILSDSDEWHVQFQDESRDIASEYMHGAQRYSIITADPPVPMNGNMDFDFTSTIPSSDMAQQALPSLGGTATYDDPNSANFFDQPRDPHSALGMQASDATYSHASMTSLQPKFEQQNTQQPNPIDENESRELLNTQEETLYMQVFVEEVGIWMDSMDPMKHFSRIMPFHALGQPMLLNAFLACGVRHLTLVNPAVYEEKTALQYYDIASRHLLRALQNPERDSVICATTAVILNVYEIMTEKALPRMNHIAGARALIRECGWNARSVGIGAACFWLNVGLETLSNLHFNWQSSWSPEDWGLVLDLSQETMPGREEVWTHRMLYIIARIGDFRATVPRTQDSPQNEQIRQHKRTNEWYQLKDLVDTWSRNIPRTMQPMAYLYPYQTTSTSCFPEIWLIKRSTIIARLFFHTAICLLAQINPIATNQVQRDEMRDLERAHAHQICGIVAHVKDRGVASVALRSLAIAAECLTVRREQEEVLQIFTRIHRDTGWRIGFIPKDLQAKWGWNPEEVRKTSVVSVHAGPSPKLPTHASPYQHLSPQQQRQAMAAQMSPNGMMAQSPLQFDQYGEMQSRKHQQQQAQAQAHAHAQAHALAQAQAQAQAAQQFAKQQQQQSPPNYKPKQGIVNPLFAGADFNMPTHPYQEYYVAPSINHQQRVHSSTGGQGLGLSVMYASQDPGPVYQY